MGQPTEKLKADTVITDIETGITDSEFMEKHALNRNQYEDLLIGMGAAGLVTEQQVTRRLGLSDSAIMRAFEDVYESRRQLACIKTVGSTERHADDTNAQPQQNEQYDLAAGKLKTILRRLFCFHSDKEGNS
jgi:AraC-like DNA-binding protein